MALFEGKTPAERNKLIAASVLGLIALIFLARMFFGGSTTTTTVRTTTTTLTGKRSVTAPTSNGVALTSSNDQIDDSSLDMLSMPLEINPVSLNVPDAGRNIFAYYVPSAPTKPRSTQVANTPTPTPTPPPPLMLSSISPVNAFARQSEFTLDVSGDKFTPQTHIFFDGQELSTRFLSPQQVSAIVPASLIAAPGARLIVVRTPDGQLYSNTATLNVTPPPTPPFTYVGILGSPRYNNDKAMLKNQSGELLSVQRGDLVASGRFKVTSISERSVEFTDTQLHIKHTLPYVESRANIPGTAPRFPQPQKSDDDDEP